MLKLKFVLVFKHRKVVANVTLQLYFEINFGTIFGTSFGKTNINQHVRVVNGPIRSGPNPARTRKCKPEPENNLIL